MNILLAPLALSAAVAVIGGSVIAQVPADAWRIGPVIKGRNYSVGMPATMQPGPQGPMFDFPSRQQGHVHYVSLDTGPLEGARKITVRYRIDGAQGVRFVQQEGSPSPAQIGLVFQRAGDTWTARGRYESYRWYSPETKPLAPGVHSISVRLDDPDWGAVMTSKAATNPRGFAEALADTQSVGFTFGGDGGRGHGVYATAPARFTLLEFRID